MPAVVPWNPTTSLWSPSRNGRGQLVDRCRGTDDEWRQGERTSRSQVNIHSDLVSTHFLGQDDAKFAAAVFTGEAGVAVRVDVRREGR